MHACTRTNTILLFTIQPQSFHRINMHLRSRGRQQKISHLRTRIAPGRGGPGPLGQGAVTGGTRPLALPCTCPLFQINVTEQKRLVSIQKNCGIVVISFDCYTHLPQLQQHTTAIHLAGLACVNEPSLLGSILSH